ncbi:hypothetical protein DF268_29130 [Streptomyces sp. V2]|uniref:DUF6461 domain-containing protein n=1 Tax=Streptomyces TaxID=1883 RepID=UPI0006EB3873|nr:MULTISPECIES: DUF6461 domain-containing protein [Streptomyces]PWG10056.1 hypothetical protein DF268_29130 [Streptomyces sp. V2]
MDMNATASLRWATAWMCVTFTRGLSPEEVFARYGADPGRARLLDWDTASDLLTGEDGVSLLRAGTLGGWTFCVEEDGVTGSLAEPLTELSRGTETYSILTTDGIDVFQHWRDGVCVENFEPGTHEGDETGAAPIVALLLNTLGIPLDDNTLAAPWPSLTLTEDDVPAVQRGDTYAGEGPVPPGTVVIL